MSRTRVWLAVAFAVFAGPPVAAGQSDPNLDQSLDAAQRVASGRRVVSAGHVDVGPRFVDGAWRMMVHDDTGKADSDEPSVWRHPEQTVLRVTDDAVLQAPDDPAYGFLHAKPGADLYVVPQTQEPEVVWVGWNTQDPEVMERIDRGATLRLAGIEGPGSLVVYLQSGDFGEPKVLWDSTAAAERLWVDVNTHTHANWVFSKPGVYLVRIEISAELIDGSRVTDTRELRFAVGSRTSTAAAFTARWPGAGNDQLPAARRGAADRVASEGEESGPTIVVGAIALLALGLAGGLAVAVIRGNRAKERARSRPGGGS